MKIKLIIGAATSAGEFKALGNLFVDLAKVREGELQNEPVVEVAQVKLDPPVVPQVTAEVVQAQASAAVEPEPETKPRRTRRTKAEIEADEAATKAAPADAVTEVAAADGDAEAAANQEARNQEDAISGESAGAQPEVVNTSTGEIVSGKTYTEADVQQLASIVARSKGPGIVKGKIAELGGDRIAALSAEKLTLLGAYLEQQK